MSSLAAQKEDPPATHPVGFRDPLVVGTICGLLAAVGYTLTNICLRYAAAEDPVWISCLRSLPTVLMYGPWLVVRKTRGEAIWPPLVVVGYIVLGGCISQFLGNTLFQYSLGIVGLAMSVPLCLGTLIVGGAVLGRVLLGEPIPLRVATSLGILLVAIAVLSLGAAEAHQSVAATLDTLRPAAHDPWRVTLGVAAACASGVCFAALGISIRYGVTNRASATTTMFIVGSVGFAGLLLGAFWRIGVEGMAATSAEALAAMLAAGFFNAVSFLAMTKALQLTNVAYAYALNASQATMGAVAGVLFFREATTPWLGIGVALTIGGLLYMRRR